MADPQWRTDERRTAPFAFQPGHRAMPSLTTQASAVADSTITFGSVASGTTEPPVRFSHFPMPPSTFPDVPGTPLNHSPVASSFTTATFPSTLGRTHAPTPPQDLHAHSLPQLPPTAPLQMRQKAQYANASYSDSLAGLPPPPAYQPRAPAMPTADEQQYQEIPYRRAPSPGSGSLSPYDWHDGSSSFVPLDTNEDRLLSTSFITSLLSTADTHATTADAGSRARGRPAHAAHAPRPSEGASCISEMTYPPPRTVHTPVLEHQPTMPGRVLPKSYTSLPGARWISHTEPSDDGWSDGAQTPGLDVPQASMDGGPRAPSQASNSPLRAHAWATGGELPPGGSSSPSYPPLSSATGSRSFRKNTTARQSVQSTRTTRSYVASSLMTRISHGAASVVRPFRRKPLPPVPALPNLSPAQLAAHRVAEEQLPLPALAERAGALSQMLEKGNYPTRSVSNYNPTEGSPMMRESGAGSWNWGTDPNYLRAIGAQTHRKSGVPGTAADAAWGAGPDSPKARGFNPRTMGKKKLGICMVLVLLVVAVGLGAGLGLGLRKKGSVANKCSTGLAGASCNLAAECVCTSSQCTKLSQNLVDLTPTVNALFAANFTSNMVATALWQAQGDPVGRDCASQAALVDVAPTLDASTSPNRTAWAQAAMLWTLVRSQNLTAAAQMRRFVQKAPWSSAGSADGPFSGEGFTTRVLGYDFDFAVQRVVEPTVLFAQDGQPSAEQAGRVGNSALTALDRMYSYASASGLQRATAMANYWTQVLQQQASDLPKFFSIVSVSPILLPFDATGNFANTPMANLLTNSSSTPFPPPLACYPGLDSSTLQAVADVETGVFGLTAPSSPAGFDQSCYASRPVYGVLNILRLRLPFLDARANLSRQAAVLERDVAPRVVVRVGESLSTKPASNDAAAPKLDPRDYGTFNHLSHVMLDYFSSIDDTNLAIALAEHVLSAPTVPPSDTSALLQELSKIPPLEVAVFGSVLPEDIASVQSSFATPSGGLFFGSDASAALRSWALTAADAPVVWTDGAGAPKVVRETSLDDSTFNLVWDPAFQFLHTQTTGVVVNVGNITAAFEAVGRMVP